MALLSQPLDHARDWGECALNLAFPWPETTAAAPVPIEKPFCRLCCEPFPSLGNDAPDFLCSNCASRDWSFQWSRSGYRTEGQVLEAIVGFKYRDEYYHYAQLVEWLAETFSKYTGPKDWDALVPVPLYHRRHRERGFNHAQEIARGLGKRVKLPLLNCLYRYRETPSQARLSRKARWDNMDGAFVMKAKFDVRGKNLLIIDDVFTTGATTNACARALAEAGAGHLAVLTVARS